LQDWIFCPFTLHPGAELGQRDTVHCYSLGSRLNGRQNVSEGSVIHRDQASLCAACPATAIPRSIHDVVGEPRPSSAGALLTQLVEQDHDLADEIIEECTIAGSPPRQHRQQRLNDE
jgi:hypothetical protein